VTENLYNRIPTGKPTIWPSLAWIYIDYDRIKMAMGPQLGRRGGINRNWGEPVMRGVIGIGLQSHLCPDLKVFNGKWAVFLGNTLATNYINMTTLVCRSALKTCNEISNSRTEIRYLERIGGIINGLSFESRISGEMEDNIGRTPKCSMGVHG